MNLADVEVFIGRNHPGWTLKVNCDGQWYLVEITIPSMQFCGYALTLDRAMAQAVERVREWDKEHGL